MKKLLFLLVFLVLSAACASAPLEASKTPPPASTGQAQTVMIFKRSGGLAGISEEWTVFSDGRIVPAKGSEIKVDSALVSALLADINTAGFFDLPSSPKPSGKCADCFSYSLTVNQDGRSKSFSAVEGDSNTPAAFMKVIEKVNQFITEAAKP